MYLAEFDCVQRIINLFEFIIFSYFTHFTRLENCNKYGENTVILYEEVSFFILVYGNQYICLSTARSAV